MLNKAAGLAVRDPNRAPAPPSSTSSRPAAPRPLPLSLPAARPGVPAQSDGFGVVDESTVPLPEQPPAPRAVDDDSEETGAEQELGFANAASASAEMLELEEYLLDEAADDDDDHWPVFPADKSAVQISVWQRKPKVIVIDP